MNPLTIQLEELRRALLLDLPYPFGRFDGELREAAVLMLLEGNPLQPDSLYVWMIRRALGDGQHQGQYAFPGGRRDPIDVDLTATVQREVHEEIGLHPGSYELVGCLPDVSTPSQYLVRPFVGVAKIPLSENTFRLQLSEVAEILRVSFSQLKAPGVRLLEQRVRNGMSLTLDAFQYGDKRIWGASAAMLANLIDRISLLDNS